MPSLVVSHLRRNVVAYVALFVALGGTSYAAVALPRNSVGATQIRPDAVRSAEVKDRSLLRQDFRQGQLPRGAAGPEGAAGPAGSPGPRGAVGPAYASQALTAPVVDPLPVARSSSQPTTLILPVPGRVFAYGHSRVSAQCVPGQSLQVGLYLDGQPIPGTGRTVAHTATADLHFTGLSAPVEAGTHTLVHGIACTGGVFPSGTTTTDLVLGGILTGS